MSRTTETPPPDEPLDLVPLDEFAEELGVDPVLLRRLWLKQVGAPQLYRLKPGLYLVSRSEAVSYIMSKAVTTARQKAVARTVIRRTVRDKTARSRGKRTRR